MVELWKEKGNSSQRIKCHFFNILEKCKENIESVEKNSIPS